MIGGGLGGVVGNAAFLGDYGVGAGGEDQVAGEALLAPGVGGFVADDVTALDVDAEGEVPFIIGNVAGGIAGPETPAVTQMLSNPP